MNKYLILILFFIIVGFSFPLFSQLELTLENSLEIALEKGPEAKIAANRFKVSGLEYKAFRASLLPSLSLSGDAPGFRRAISAITQPDGSRQFILQNQAYSTATMTLNQSIPWTGGNVSVISGLNRLDIYSPSLYGRWQSTPLLVGYTQPLFRFNSSKWQLKSKPLEYSIQEIRYYEAIENIKASIAGSFFDLYIAKLQYENDQYNLSVNDSIFKISQGRYNLGKIAENELLQSELAFLNSQTSLRQSELSLNQARLQLLLSLGLPYDTEVKLSSQARIPELFTSTEIALQYAKKYKSELRQMEISHLNAKSEVAMAKSNMSPGLNLNASFGFNQSGNTLNEAYKNPVDQQNASMGFSIPIFGWGNGKANYEAAVVQLKVVEDQNELSRQRILQGLEFRVNNFHILKINAEIAAKSDTIAQRRYNVAMERYLIGKIDITNLQIAQNEKDMARQNFARSLKTYWQAYYELRRETLFDFEIQQAILPGAQ